MTVLRLADSSLNALPQIIERPSYDRASVQPGIVHLGVGAFHRAHQAVLTDDRLNAGETDWGIVGASLRSPATRDALAPQDNLYTLAIRSGEETRLRVIGSLKSLIVVPEEPDRLLEALTDPRIRIVSLTITEKGYKADLNTGDLKTDDRDVQHDLAGEGSPRTALGLLCEAVSRRRAAGAAPFTLLSCDNLPANGRTLKRAITQFAEARDPDLGRYVAGEVQCPSTMVDRIVPATTDADRREVADALGVEDAWPVMAEPFLQWVIEDRFTSGRPAWEVSGAEFVENVASYEHMKLRLLNGAHTLIAAMGRVGGLATVADAMADENVQRFLGTYWNEVIPTVDAGLDGFGYTERLRKRFANTALEHGTAQIASDASQKLPQRVLAPLRERLEAGTPTTALTFAAAAWIRSCGGADEAGTPLTLNDPVFQAAPPRIDQAAATPEQTADSFLGVSSVFGSDLPAHAGFRRDLVMALDDIGRMGILAAARKRSDAADR